MTTITKSKQPKRKSWLTEYTFLFFILFFIIVLWGFWSSYYKTFFSSHTWPIRFHGTAMSLWCVMLILQAFLIRIRKNKLHRFIGKLSYVIIPLILISGVHLAQMTIKQAPPGTAPYYYMIALMFNSLLSFAIFYGLAMWHRRKSIIHARYMIATIFPLVTPATDRIIYKYFDFLVPHAPMLPGGIPIVPAFGFALVDLILIVLILIDWLKHRRLTVFPFVLAVTILYQISVLTFYRYPFWQAIGDWVMKMF